MKTSHKIRKIQNYIAHIRAGEKFYIGIRAENDVAERLTQIGFSLPLVPGERLLPAAEGGTSCRRNADGYFIKHRDLPMETATRQVEWHWNEFHGRGVTVPQSGIRDVPFERYQRTHVPAYSREVELVVRTDGHKYAVSGPFEHGAPDEASATNTANVFVEVFGSFEVLDANLDGWVRAPIRKLNWQILPPGKNPWAAAQPSLDVFVYTAAAGNQPVVRARINHVKKFNPEFVAVGMGGFSHYVVFGFPRCNLCILESTEVNNATYVLNMELWEDVAQLTKAEVLNLNRHRARVIHSASWFHELDRLMSMPSVIAA